MNTSIDEYSVKIMNKKLEIIEKEFVEADLLLEVLRDAFLHSAQVENLSFGYVNLLNTAREHLKVISNQF